MEDHIALAIIYGRVPANVDAYQRGWDAHFAGVPWHEMPQPHSSVESLSWRMGWNDRALYERG